jgi:hypothetical protein
MKRLNRFSTAATAAFFLLVFSVSQVRADVNVVNQSGETLFVSTGQIVGGRLVYGGWTRIDHNARAQVYTGSDPRIMLSVLSIRNSGPYAWRINNPIAAAEMTVASDDYHCELVGGATPQWQMTNRGQNSVWVYDEFHPWPADMNLFTTMFYVVPGNLDQRFIP